MNFLEDIEQKYIEFITSQTFKTHNLKKDFISVLHSNYSERKNLWDVLIKNHQPELSDFMKMANPYFIGFGNPKSDILFLGKEKGFDMVKNTDGFFHESINNTLIWKLIHKTFVDDINHKEIQEQFGFNPFFPKLYYNQTMSKRHTWSLYSKIVNHISNNNSDSFNECTNFEMSFFSKCFLSEINHIPSRYSEGRKMISNRKDFFENSYFKKFKIVIIGAKGYLEIDEIKSLFNLNVECNEIIIGRNKRSEIKMLKFQDKEKIVIYCNQLSGAAGWTNEAVYNLASHCNFGS